MCILLLGFYFECVPDLHGCGKEGFWVLEEITVSALMESLLDPKNTGASTRRKSPYDYEVRRWAQVGGMGKVFDRCKSRGYSAARISRELKACPCREGRFFTVDYLRKREEPFRKRCGDCEVKLRRSKFTKARIKESLKKSAKRPDLDARLRLTRMPDRKDWEKVGGDWEWTVDDVELMRRSAPAESSRLEQTMSEVSTKYSLLSSEQGSGDDSTLQTLENSGDIGRDEPYDINEAIARLGFGGTGSSVSVFESQSEVTGISLDSSVDPSQSEYAESQPSTRESRSSVARESQASQSISAASVRS
jgi:hypothetical protein